jgi:hypothetical protein
VDNRCLAVDIAIIKIAYNATNLHEDWNPAEPAGYSLYPVFLDEADKALALLRDDGYDPS